MLFVYITTYEIKTIVLLTTVTYLLTNANFVFVPLLGFNWKPYATLFNAISYMLYKLKIT